MDKKEDAGKEFEQELDSDTRFNFPQMLTERVTLGKKLVIAPEQANWLVCEEEEYVAFCFFRDGKSIEEVEKLLSNGQKMDSGQVATAVSRLITQIIGKEFLRGAMVDEGQMFKIVSLFLTAGCNLRCTTCWKRATIAGPDECSLDHWKTFLGAFKEFGGQIVTLTGGEPMLNLDCFKVAQHAKELGLKVVLLTNGTLVTKENAKALSDWCDEVQIGIDGPTAETHESVRGKGTFAKAISAIRELSAYPQCRLSIAITPTPATLPSLKSDLRQFATQMKEISPSIGFRVTRKLMEGRDIPSMTEEVARVFRKDVLALCDDQLEKDFSYKIDAATIIPNRRVFGCGLASTFSVWENGNIVICGYSPDPFGNIKNMGDGHMFFLNVTKALGQLLQSTRVENVHPCENCDLRYFCGGKCRKENRVAYGDPTICECDEEYKNEWYERLVRINPYVVEPITDI